MSSKIKIMHVISDTNIGGAGKYLINYCEGYDKEAFDIYVVLPLDSLLITELKQAKVNIIEIDGMMDNSKDLKAIKKLKDIIDKVSPDIVHTHASLSARFAARKAKCKPKIVYTKHCDFEVSKIYNYKIIRSLFGYFTKMYADKIIATSRHSRENLLKQGINENLVVTIVNGTKGHNKLSNDEINRIKKEYNLKDEFVIGYIARLVELKGHMYLLETVKYLIDNYKDLKFKCLIVGSGEFEQSIKDKAKELNIEDDIIFTGFVKEIEKIVNILDIQVNCSYLSETTNLALLEGMSVGVPSVSSDIGGITDMIVNDVNGELVPIKDYEKMAKEIYKILSDKDLYNKMRENSVRIFNEKYTQSVFCKNIEKVYLELTSSK